MVSVLLATNNFNNIKKIIDILSMYKQFRIVCITSNSDETYNKILQLKPDLVIISMDILISNFNLLIHKLEKQNSNINFIIINVSNLQLFQNLKTKINIIDYISLENIEEISNSLNKQLKLIDTKSLEKYIMNE